MKWLKDNVALLLIGIVVAAGLVGVWAMSISTQSNPTSGFMGTDNNTSVNTASNNNAATNQSTTQSSKSTKSTNANSGSSSNKSSSSGSSNSGSSSNNENSGLTGGNYVPDPNNPHGTTSNSWVVIYQIFRGVM